MMKFQFLLVCLSLFQHLYAEAFTAATPPTTRTTTTTTVSTSSSSLHATKKKANKNRRSFLIETLSEAATATAAVTSLAFVVPTPFTDKAYASGGATAGGAYLLSAKQRYNERVKSGVKSFVGLRPALENSDIDAVRAFFADENVGGWKDFSAAGYLLANAFRTNSSAAPDTLPSVKKWKAFANQVESMTKALKKKDMPSAMAAYDSAVTALDEYLGKVDLPSAKEL